MATIENIKKRINSLENMWLKIKGKPLSSVTAKQDSLARGLERVRASIERYFRMNSHEKKQCKALLGSLLEISENLKLSYLCPAAYTGSFDIFDTIKEMDKKSAVWKAEVTLQLFLIFLLLIPHFLDVLHGLQNEELLDHVQSSKLYLIFLEMILVLIVV